MSINEYIINAIKKTELYKVTYKYRWRERMVCRGKENPDKCFYVIRRHGITAGLFSFVITNLGAIKSAVDAGYTPVVDMMNSPNPMIPVDQVGKTNAWDLFFEQPFDYSMEDIKKSKSIILGIIDPPADYPDYPILMSEDTISFWREQMHRYIKVKSEIMADCDKYYYEMIKPQNTLGILARGTDYTNSKPYGHPVQPDIDMLIADTTGIIEEQNIERIYLATEDEDIWNRFQLEFPGIVISFQKNRFKLKGGENINEIGNAKLSPYERNREYLISMLLLSRCDALLAGATSGSIGALLMSDGYQYYKIYQLGTYK